MAIAAALPASELDAKLSKPNVLFIAIDDLRPELGCYGNPQVKSPNIDGLASQGVLFNRAYCQVPICGASRASLMTSVLPTAERFVGAGAMVDMDAPGTVTMPQVFKEAGYVTISNGKIFHHPTDSASRSWSEPPWNPEMEQKDNLDPATALVKSARGRNRIYESPDVADNAYPDGQIAERTIADLQRLKESGQPFFLTCGLHRPHMPFYAPKKYWDLYERSQIEIADNRQQPENAPKGLHGSAEYCSYSLGDYQNNTDDFHRMMRHGYYASASYSDKLVGDILNELERLGLAENTIVVLWGDHGWNLGEHDFWGKHNTLHTSLRVPLIVKVPGMSAGRKSDALVGTYDIFPTLCALVGLAMPDSAQGRSLTPLLDDPNQSFRDVIYSRFMAGDAVVTDHLIYTSYGPDGEMLYDLRKDPQENHNIAGNPEYATELAKMKRLLAANEATAAQAKVAAPISHNKKAGKGADAAE